MKIRLEKPYRIIWSEWDGHRKTPVSFLFLKKFTTAKEAESQMVQMARSSIYRECTLGIVKEMGITAEGARVPTE